MYMYMCIYIYIYMAASRLFVCTIWAPPRARPVDHYRPERPRMAQAAPDRHASVIRLANPPPAGARQRARANHLTNTVGSVMGAGCGIGEFIASIRIIIGFVFGVIL